MDLPSISGFYPGALVRCTPDDDSLLQAARDLALDALHVHTLVEIPDGFPAGENPALVRTMHGHEAYCPSGTRFLALPSARPCPRSYHLAGCTWGHFANHCGSIRPAQFLGNFRRTERERRSARRFFTVAISRFVESQMIRSGYQAARIRTILLPTPSARDVSPPPREEPPLVLFLGRLVASKGAQWLLEAAARVRSPFQLEIAGRGPYEQSLRRLAHKLGLETRVRWSGWLDSSEVAARLVMARAVVFPSLWHEPAGLVTTEAAASARAVIASEVGGIPEYADSLGHCLLVPPGNVDALAAAMTSLLDDYNLAARLGQVGCARITSGVLGLDEHLDQLEQVYRRKHAS